MRVAYTDFCYKFWHGSLYHFQEIKSQLQEIYWSPFDRSFLVDIQRDQLQNDRQNLPRYLPSIYGFISWKWAWFKYG